MAKKMDIHDGRTMRLRLRPKPPAECQQCGATIPAGRALCDDCASRLRIQTKGLRHMSEPAFTTTSEETVDELARQRQAANPSLTREQAWVQVLTERPQLYDGVLIEHATRRELKRALNRIGGQS